MAFSRCQSGILIAEASVALVVDGVVRLHAVFPLCGIFARYDRDGRLIDGIAELLEMLVLDAARVGHVVAGVVDDGIALVVGHGQCFFLESYGAILQFAEAIVEVLIDFPREDDLVGQSLPVAAITEEVSASPGLNACQQSVDQAVVASRGNTLVEVVEIVVVIDQSHGQTLDDEGGQLSALAPPLLFGIFLDEPFVDVRSDEEQSLLFEVLWCVVALVADHLKSGFLALFLDDGGSFGRAGDTPHLMERVHIEGQVVKLALVVGQRRVRVSVEGHKRVDKLPYLLVGSVENMCAVLVYVDALALFAIDVASQMGALVDHQALLALPMCHAGIGRPEESSANHQEVVFSFHSHKIFILRANIRRKSECAKKMPDK